MRSIDGAPARRYLEALIAPACHRTAGKTLIWIDPPLDFSTPFGKTMANVLITFAELELAVISDRIREAWHALREAGKWPGGPVPFGRMRLSRLRRELAARYDTTERDGTSAGDGPPH